jgi:hypothetical protein
MVMSNQYVSRVSPISLAFVDNPALEAAFHQYDNSNRRFSDLSFCIVHFSLYLRAVVKALYGAMPITPTALVMVTASLVNRVWPLPGLFLSDKRYGMRD